MNCFQRRLVLLLLLGFSEPAILLAADWYRWRGPELNGISRETELLESWPDSGPIITWKADVGTGFSSVAVSAGRAFTMGNRDNVDTVFCFDAKSGAVIWTHTYPAPLDDKFFEGGPTSTPTVDVDVVYTLSRLGDAYCFDVATGQVRWSRNVAELAGVRVPGWGCSASPLVHDDRLILGVGETGTAVDKRTGALIWTSADKEAGYATPLPFQRDGQWFALIASGKFFHAVDLATGKEAWRHRWLTQFGCNAADPIVVNGQVFLSSGYNRGSTLLKLTDSAPEVVWSSKAFQNQMSSSVLLDGYLYGIDGDTTAALSLKCVELATGTIQWSEDGFGSGTLLAAGSRLLILSERGELVIATASPDSLQVLARAPVIAGKCWTVPTLAHGRVYCRNATGELVCVNLRR